MPSDLLKNIKHSGTGVPASRAFQVHSNNIIIISTLDYQVQVLLILKKIYIPITDYLCGYNDIIFQNYCRY